MCSNTRCPLRCRCGTTTIYTDSAYVVHAFRQFQIGCQAEFLRSSANTDLLRLLVWFAEVRVGKVKSDLDPIRVHDPDQCWSVLGNQCADEACKGAPAADLSVVREMMEEAACFVSKQQHDLKRVFAYLLHLHETTLVRCNGSAQSSLQGEDAQSLEGTLERPAVQRWISVKAQPGRYSRFRRGGHSLRDEHGSGRTLWFGQQRKTPPSKVLQPWCCCASMWWIPHRCHHTRFPSLPL